MTTNEISERLDKIESLVKDPPRSFEDCIRVARLNFEERARRENQILADFKSIVQDKFGAGGAAN